MNYNQLTSEQTEKEREKSFVFDNDLTKKKNDAIIIYNKETPLDELNFSDSFILETKDNYFIIKL